MLGLGVSKTSGTPRTRSPSPKQEVWVGVCTATGYATSQLEGEAAGTAEYPRFTYEDAIIYNKGTVG